MSSKKVSIGIIGCGGRVLTVMKNILKTQYKDQVEVTALFDPYRPAVEKWQKEIAPNAKVYESEADMLANSDTDWVFIGSWNCYHADQVVAAMAAGKHVFCEKPLATTLEDCLRIKEAVEKAPDQRFFFGLVLRYTPVYGKVKELMDSGKMGDLISFDFTETLNFNHGGYIHGNWRREKKYSGSHLLEKCCHDLDLVNWITKSLPTKVASFGGRDFFVPKHRPFADSLGVNSDGKAAYQVWPDPDPVDPFSEGADIVDNQVAIFEYASGARASFHTNCNTSFHERRMQLLGAKGTIRADAVAGIVEFQPIGFDTKKETWNLNSGTDGHYGGDMLMADSLCRSMLEGETPRAGIDEALRSAISSFGADIAMDEGRIYDYRKMWEKAGISL